MREDVRFLLEALLALWLAVLSGAWALIHGRLNTLEEGRLVDSKELSKEFQAQRDRLDQMQEKVVAKIDAHSREAARSQEKLRAEITADVKHIHDKIDQLIAQRGRT